MDIIEGKEFKFNNTCVTIGKFDGIHIGHQLILNTVTDISKKMGYKSTVFTFDFDYFKSEDEIRLNSREEKKKILEKFGIELFIDYPFDPETKNETPEEFTLNVLVRKLDCRAVIVGENFRFGKGASGDVSTLRELGERFGFKVYAVPLVKYRGDMVSSTRIREEINAGHTGNVKKMLMGI